MPDKPLWMVTGGLAAGAVIMRRSRQRASDPIAGDRWLTVTINRAPGDVQPDKLPAPLREYCDRIETRVGPAPGDRETEVAVRLKERPPPLRVRGGAVRLNRGGTRKGRGGGPRSVVPGGRDDEVCRL